MPHFETPSVVNLIVNLGSGAGTGDLYLATRLFHLDALPVFADESIYIRWAQLLRHDTAYLFFALNDGKPPFLFDDCRHAVTGVTAFIGGSFAQCAGGIGSVSGE